MKKLYVYLFLISFINISYIYAQDNSELILGNWNLYKKGGNPNSITSYLNYNFLDNGTFFVSNEPLNKGKNGQYAVRHGNILTVSYTHFKIELINKNEMILSDYNDNSILYYFQRPKLKELNDSLVVEYEMNKVEFRLSKNSQMDDRILKGYSLGIIKKYSLFKFPQFVGEEGFYKFLQYYLNYHKKEFKKENERIINVSFNINQKGQVYDIIVKGKPEDNNLVKKIERILKRRENKWDPIVFEGKYYDSRVSIPVEFRYTKFPY